jgi:benzoyl-CoA 2,3-dioxygenase component B
MFTFFTDRDGKFQLSALTESAFDPLARTTRFMLTEEGHHMFVGRNGIKRIIERTAEVMSRERTDNPERLRALGVIDLPTMQRYLNFHSSVTVDLFGADLSSNAATFYTTGLKARYLENRIADDHVLTEATYPILDASSAELLKRDAPALNALNERLRDDFIQDSVSGVEAWNTVLKKQGIDFKLVVPHKAFNRQIGPLAGLKVSPEGKQISAETWNAKVHDWLPTPTDRAFVQSLMGRVVEPGQFANWIAPPSSGINGQSIECEYVRFN